VLTLAMWVMGQDLGALYTGEATDPNSGLLLALMAISLLVGFRQSAPDRSEDPGASKGPLILTSWPSRS
jgi:hypothetical protein